MTEERLIVDEDYNIVDTLTGEGLDDNQMFDLVNELHKENIRLKREFDSCSHNWALMYDEAKNKVEELSEENTILKTTNDEMEDYLTQLEEKNQWLKKKEVLANYRGKMVAFANSLIQDFADETSQQIWENFKNEMYNEWKQK